MRTIGVLGNKSLKRLDQRSVLSGQKRAPTRLQIHQRSINHLIFRRSVELRDLTLEDDTFVGDAWRNANLDGEIGGGFVGNLSVDPLPSFDHHGIGEGRKSESTQRGNDRQNGKNSNHETPQMKADNRGEANEF